MIEAWASIQDDTSSRNRPVDRQVKATSLAREVFGKFVPQINYPSPLEIEHKLSREVASAIYTVSLSDQELLSRAFLGVLSALFANRKMTKETAETILDDIKSLSEGLETSPLPAAGFFSTPKGMYDELNQTINALKIHGEIEESGIRILEVYRDTLARRSKVQKAAFEAVNNYLDAVNEFLEGKEMITRLKEESIHLDNLVKISFDDGNVTGLETLSSGERQIVTLIYAATHMNRQKVVLIDEPELSLHVDWQRMLLIKMAEQLQDRQIIACTHSPVVAADYRGQLRELRFIPTNAIQETAKP